MEQNSPYSTDERLSQFSSDLDNLVVHQDASRGERFANFIVDLICAYIVIFICGVILALTLPGFGATLAAEEGSFSVTTNFVGIIFFLLYYTVIEGATGGRSIGKFITGTKATTLNGEKLSWGDAFKRSLCRIVPFEAFSGFGTPWHDKWTNTTVVKNK
ncbi:RDD family protein [uncultured Chitinophaga sp.]|uniref:RDD family protein n=1 Tax=uncultured Chitinophaga sp. TaxID=339340 RepID=UPI0025E09EF8|nr:RDD family protein [uncultured Chitinophaga sp.]